MVGPIFSIFLLSEFVQNFGLNFELLIFSNDFGNGNYFHYFRQKYYFHCYIVFYIIHIIDTQQQINITSFTQKYTLKKYYKILS
jgi:hypothetical protein